MKNKAGFTLIEIMAVVNLLFIVVIAGCWIGNLAKFCKSDFKAPYKREIIHGIGIVPVVSVATVWFNIDETGEDT